MEQIIKELKEHDFFSDFKMRKKIYIVTGIYSFFMFILVIDTILSFGIFNNVDKVLGILLNFGIILYLLTFISLIKEGGENIEFKEAKNIEEKLLLLLFKNNKKYTKKEIQNEYFKKEYQKDIGDSYFSDLQSKSGRKYSGIRRKYNLGALINYKDGEKVGLTELGKKYVKEKLINQK